MTEKHDEVRILALVPGEMQGQIRRQLEPLEVMIDFIGKAAELSHVVLSRKTYQVALLPAVVPDNGWWSLWGEIAVLNPQPEILVYAHSASFELWSGVLELGGYDVIVAPFSDEELQSAILCAASSFYERYLDEDGKE